MQQSSNTQQNKNNLLFDALQNIVSQEDAIHKIKSLLDDGADIDAKNDERNTVLHISVATNFREVVKFLLTRGAKVNVKNKDGKTAIQLARDNFHITRALTASVNIPKDGNCLFWAAALSYLTPVKNKIGQFKQRVAQLFGSEKDIELLQQVIEDYNPFSNSNAINDEAVESLVTENFRGRVVHHMRTKKKQFRRYVEGNFEQYLTTMKNPGSWGGKLEIAAISELLECAIVVNGNVVHISRNGSIVLYQTCADNESSPSNGNLYEFGVACDIIDDYQRESTEQDEYETKESGTTETVISPHADVLKFDAELEITRPFRESLTDRLKDLNINHIEHLRSTPNYPTPKTLAQLAMNVYTDSESVSELEGWEFLTAATNTGFCNEYYGKAYWNPKTYQVVIAHRGSDLAKLAVWYTDLAGIVGNVTVPQMHSACTFAARIGEVLKELGEKHKIQFQVFFTGHSLGGWLAQITTFSTKYLEIEDDLFQMSKSKGQESNWHAHTVVFDSPGCKETLAHLKTKYDVRYDGRAVYLGSLDITSYLSAPNIINTRNEHVGTLHRVFVEMGKTNKQSKWPIINFLTQIIDIPSNIVQYTKDTHCKEKICLALDYKDKFGKPKIETVVDWPVSSVTSFSSTEYLEYHEMAKNLNQYHADAEATGFKEVVSHLKGRNPVRYQTKPYDGATCRINVFTRYEQQFLGKCEWLQKFPAYLESAVKNTIDDTTLTKNVELYLTKFRITGEYVTCETPEMMQKFVPYVKRLLFFYKDLQEKIDSQINQPTVHFNRGIYELDSNYVTTDQEFKDLSGIFNDGKDDVKQFLGDQGKKVMHVMVEHDLRSTSAKMYQAFCKMENMDNCTVHTLSKLLIVDYRFVRLENFLREATKHLLIIQCEPNTDPDYLSAACELFASIVSILKANSNKIIAVTRKDDKFGSFLKREYTKQFMDGQYVTTEDNGAIWSELSSVTQQNMLRQEVIFFQGEKEKTSLIEIVGTTNVEMMSNELAKMSDSETILQLIRNDPLIIGSKPHCLRDIECSFIKNYFDIRPDDLVNSLLQHADGKIYKIYMITISGSNLSPNKSAEDHFQARLCAKDDAWKTIQGMINKTIYLHVAKDFHENYIKWMELCQSYIDKRVFWLEVSDGRICCQQIYDANLYVKRQFDYPERVIEEGVLQGRFDDTLIISGRKDEGEELKTVNENVQFADTEESAEKLFNDQIASDTPRHYLSWEMIGEHKKLVWHMSHGSLQALRSHVSKTSSPHRPIDEKAFITKDGRMKNKVVIVSGEPGMGKSTTLTSLAEQVVQTNFVIRVDLRDCQLAMSRLPSEAKDHNIETAVEFFAAVDSTGFSSNLAKTVLKFGLEGKMKMSREMFLLFDGFDEIIHNDHANSIVGLLQFLQKMNTTNIWITTREYRTALLEDKLSVFATSFAKVLRSKQQEFLEKFWEISLSLQRHNLIKEYPEKIAEYAENLLDIVGSFFGQDIYSLMGVPLQTRMMAEAFQPSVETLNNFKTGDFNDKRHDMRAHKLYSTFIKMKYKIYFRKTGISCATEQQKRWLTQKLHESHTRLAVEELFPDKVDELLLGFLNSKSDTRCLMELNRVGLIQSTHGDEKYRWMHRSFAEYFTADALANCRLSINQQLLSEVLQQGEEVLPQGEKVLPQGEEVSPQPDYKVIRLLHDEIRRELISEFLATAQVGNLDRMKRILSEMTLAIGRESLIKETDENMRTALHIASEQGHVSVVEYLLENKAPVDAKDINEENLENFTPMHYAAKFGHDEIVTMLLRKSADINATDRGGFTPLHQAVRANRTGTVRLLLQNGCDIAIKDKTRMTAFAWASRSGNMDTVRLLTDMDLYRSNTLSIDDIDRNGMTALHHATKGGKWNVVEFLVNNGADVNKQDLNGNSPLSRATKAGKRDIIEIMLQSTGNTN